MFPPILLYQCCLDRDSLQKLKKYIDILLMSKGAERNLEVIELTGYKFKCDKFVQLALVHVLYSSG